MTRCFRQGLAALLAFAAAWLSAAFEARACAGCRNPSLPTAGGAAGPLPAGALRVSGSLSATAVHVVHEAGCADVTDCSEAPIQPLYLHDQHLYPVELRASAEYGISTLFGVEARVPFRAVAARIDYTTPEGEPHEPLDPGIHHRDETVAGFADPWLLFRVGDHAGVTWLAARAGVSVPIGSTEEDPFELGDRGQRHQHIQLGSGTVDPVVAVELAAPLDTWNLRLFAEAQVPLYDNSHGYRAPSRIYGGASIGHVLFGELSGSAGLEASHETPERWSGVERQDGNLGRTELLGALGLSHALGSGSLSFDLRFPIVRHLVQGEEAQGSLSSPIALTLAYSHVFGDREASHAP